MMTVIPKPTEHSSELLKKYDLQKHILKYFGFTDDRMKQNVLSLSG
jgi:hypothetical protein